MRGCKFPTKLVYLSASHYHISQLLQSLNEGRKAPNNFTHSWKLLTEIRTKNLRSLTCQSSIYLRYLSSSKCVLFCRFESLNFEARLVYACHTFQRKSRSGQYSRNLEYTCGFRVTFHGPTLHSELDV